MVKLNDPVFATIGELSAYAQRPVDLDNDEQVAQFKAALCAAERAVAAWLDADTLEEHQVTVSTQLARPKPTIEVDDGPITTIQSVTVGGTVLDPTTVEISPAWAVFRNDNLFPENTAIELDYLAGYRVNSDGTTTLPTRIRQAILEVATTRLAAPDTGLIRERIGDWAGERADPAAGAQAPPITPSVQSLLMRYRRPLY
jgi:hypothetical protein